MSRSDLLRAPQGHMSHDSRTSACGPSCQYKELYRGALRTNAEMSKTITAATERANHLRAGLVSMLKRLYPKSVRDAENTGGTRLENVSDEVLLSFVEAFFNKGGVESFIKELKLAFEEEGYSLSEGVSASQIVQAVIEQGGPGPGGGPEAASLAGARNPFGGPVTTSEGIQTAQPSADDVAKRLNLDEALAALATPPGHTPTASPAKQEPGEAGRDQSSEGGLEAGSTLGSLLAAGGETLRTPPTRNHVYENPGSLGELLGGRSEVADEAETPSVSLGSILETPPTTEPQERGVTLGGVLAGSQISHPEGNGGETLSGGVVSEQTTSEDGADLLVFDDLTEDGVTDDGFEAVDSDAGFDTEFGDEVDIEPLDALAEEALDVAMPSEEPVEGAETGVTGAQLLQGGWVASSSQEASKALKQASVPRSEVPAAKSRPPAASRPQETADVAVVKPGTAPTPLDFVRSAAGPVFEADLREQYNEACQTFLEEVRGGAVDGVFLVAGQQNTTKYGDLIVTDTSAGHWGELVKQLRGRDLYSAALLLRWKGHYVRELLPGPTPTLILHERAGTTAAVLATDTPDHASLKAAVERLYDRRLSELWVLSESQAGVASLTEVLTGDHPFPVLGATVKKYAEGTVSSPVIY